MEENKSQDIPEMNLDVKYSNKLPEVSQNTTDAKKKMDETKKEIEKLKKFILKKFSYTQAIGVLPPQAIKFFIEEEEVPKESEKFVHLYMIVPEDKFKEIPKIKQEVVKELEKSKEKVWLQVKTPVDVWECGLDQKFEITGAIAMSFPLHDTGILSGLRVAEIHKSLVLQKFEKYVVSYVIAGSLVRGDATKTSDVDVFIIINDTDVKSMPRLELKERLRNIIWQYISEAAAMAGVDPKILNVQPYLLTDFWESVKDANPVMFTFIRDGVPLYDRGTFMPWKALLRMGKLKPSPEAIDMFMSMGDKTVTRAKRMLLDIVIQDVYWAVITPAQALVMLSGNPPPTPKQVVSEMKRIFCGKDKMLEAKYISFLEKIVGLYKGYEHEKVKEIKGIEIDKILKETDEYLKRLKELRKQIDEKSQVKTIQKIYDDAFDLLKTMTKKKSEKEVVSAFEKDFVKNGKFSNQHIRILNNIVSARNEVKKGKSDTHKVDRARKEAYTLISDITEYNQRCDLVPLEKGKMLIKYKIEDKVQIAEILNANGMTFLLTDGLIQKVTDKIENSTADEMDLAIKEQRRVQNVNINPKVFDILRKKLGDFEIVL
jgi:predicted nucleotidyltransferase/uncharacterized protein (UPF0332 family)